MDAMCDSDEGLLAVTAACEKEKMLDMAMVVKETNVYSMPLLKTLFVLFSISAEMARSAVWRCSFLW